MKNVLNSPRDSLCNTHMIKNDLYCFDDKKNICVRCIPSHLHHRLEYLENFKNSNNYPNIYKRNPNSPKTDPQKSPYSNSNSNSNSQNPNYNPMSYRTNEKPFLAINPQDLIGLQNSYNELKSRINNMLDKEIDNINTVLQNSKKNPNYLVPATNSNINQINNNNPELAKNISPNQSRAINSNNNPLIKTYNPLNPSTMFRDDLEKKTNQTVGSFNPPLNSSIFNPPPKENSAVNPSQPPFYDNKTNQLPINNPSDSIFNNNLQGFSIINPNPNQNQIPSSSVAIPKSSDLYPNNLTFGKQNEVNYNNKQLPSSMILDDNNDLGNSLIPSKISASNQNLISKNNLNPPEILPQTFNINQRSFAPYKESLLILKIDQNPGEIYIFDSLSLAGRKIKLQTKVIPSDSAIILCEGRILVAGGTNEMNVPVSECNYIDINSLAVIKRGMMNHDKRNHTMVKFDDSLIFSIGGFSQTLGYLKACECYKVSEDIWEEIAQLSIERQDISVCTFNPSFLYSFGGAVYENGIWNYMSLIERLDVNANNAGWEPIQFAENSCWTPRSFTGARQLTDNEIMVFGGFDGSHYNDVMMFNVSYNSFIPTKLTLRRASSFIQRNTSITEDNNNMYAIGFSNFDIHRFSFIRRVWEYMNENKWFTSL